MKCFDSQKAREAELPLTIQDDTQQAHTISKKFFQVPVDFSFEKGLADESMVSLSI